jgi:hypothetical protein
MYYLETLWQRVGNNTERGNGTEIELMRKLLQEHKKQVSLFHMYMSETKGYNATKHTGRRLMQEDDRVVSSYSSLVASTQGYSNIAVASSKLSSIPLITDTWLEGPFGWPPR